MKFLKIASKADLLLLLLLILLLAAVLLHVLHLQSNNKIWISIVDSDLQSEAVSQSGGGLPP